MAKSRIQQPKVAFHCDRKNHNNGHQSDSNQTFTERFGRPTPRGGPRGRVLKKRDHPNQIAFPDFTGVVADAGTRAKRPQARSTPGNWALERG